MKIDKQLVDKLAQLAKLHFDDESKQEIVDDLNKILGFVNKLNEVNTTGVEPLTLITDEQDILRKDEVKQEISRKQALSNAPKKSNKFFIVPKVIKKGSE